MAKKTKNERNAKGTKYCAELASSKALDKANEMCDINAQCVELENASEKSLDNFTALKSKKYQTIDLTEKGVFATIQKGGKFVVNGIQFVTYTKTMVENSGIVRKETDVYFPQIDERKLVGSVTSLKARVESVRKKMAKLGLI